MKIHTSLTQAEVYSCLPANVYANITPKGSRKRENAYECTLYVYEPDSLHRRRGNSGGYGSSDLYAATWDEWGVWMDNIYKQDPDAIIGWYATQAEFVDITRTERDRIRSFNKAESLQVRTHTAPWLARTPKGRR